MNITKCTLAATVLCGFGVLALLPTNAYADQFDVSWSGAFGAGTGTIDATNEGGGEFLVTSIDATQAGLDLTLLAPNTYGSNDNLLFPGATVKLDDFGLAFSDGTNSYDVFAPPPFPGTYWECSSAQSNCEGLASGVGHELTSFSVRPAPAATPEPGAVGLLATGLFGLLGMGLRRKRLSYPS